ncbi:hypothetical protein BGZ58_008153, partial [Dissophora ornata]
MPRQQPQQEDIYDNPYKAPSYMNSTAFVPPKVSGYDFRGGSQAGNMGLMMGRRISDGALITAKLHQSRVILQHEHRILKRLQIIDSGYDPNATMSPGFAFAEPETSQPETISEADANKDGCSEHGHNNSAGVKPTVYEAGLVEGEKYFNRIVEDFIDLDQVGMSILIMRRLGSNLLSSQHHRFLGLDDTDGHQSSEAESRHPTGSPFPDAFTFLVFCLKAACILEALQRSNLAHLAICPTAFHWERPDTDVATQSSDNKLGGQGQSRKPLVRNPSSLYHDVDPTGGDESSKNLKQEQSTDTSQQGSAHMRSSHEGGEPLPAVLDVNKTKLRLFDFTHSKILSHERARAPSNIVEWQIPGYLEYHLHQRYQNAFGFKQDILRCLCELHRTGIIESFPLGEHDVSYQFVLPNTVFGRHVEQQMISAAIAQAANAYQNSLNSDISDTYSEQGDLAAMRVAALNDSDHYVFEDDIVSLQNQAHAKIPVSSRTLLRTPKPFDGGKSVHRGSETADPVVRAIFVSGPSGVGKTVLIRRMATVARNSGLFAGGVFEAEGSEPYAAILSCIQCVLQQLLTQHTDALASLVVAIRTAFEPDSGIDIVCDLIPELKYFFHGTEAPERVDIPLTHSVSRFHALILKLIRVISTHFFMTWLIDDIHYADENSIALLATLVNVSKRLPIVLIMTHRDTVDCLIKVKQILGGSNVSSNSHTGSQCSPGSAHHDSLVDEISSMSYSIPSPTSMTKTTAIRAAGLPLIVRGGGGVRFIRLQDPKLETIQEFLGVLLHRDKADVLPLATVLHHKSWLAIRQLLLELYRNQTIYFNFHTRAWDWQSCPETLVEVVRKLSGEEYSFLEARFRALDCDTKKILICAAMCGTIFTIQSLQRLASTAYIWSEHVANRPPEHRNHAPETIISDTNKGSSAMAGLQSALREGILVYTSVPDTLRWHHNVMRKVSLGLLEGTDEKERMHYEMAKVLFKTPGEEFRTANHVLQCLDLVKKKISSSAQDDPEKKPYWVPVIDDGCRDLLTELDAQSLRTILSLAGEKSQKSGAQDMALAFWNAALSLLPENCWDPPAPTDRDVDGSGDVCMDDDMYIEKTPGKTALYHDALKIHLRCIEAERWRENFDQAMKICDTALAKISDPIDRAQVYKHQIEMSVWAYSQPEKATNIAIQCLQELGMPKDVSFNPTQEEIRELYDETHQMLLDHMDELTAENPKICSDPRINMMMEVLSISNATLYYCNIPFLAVGVAQSMKLTCENGFTNDVGRALVSFALTHSTWHGCLENAYELGKLACKVSKNNHVKFLFYLTVQQWGDHIANSIPALEETLQATELTCDRLFHTAGMVHVSVMRVLLGRVHLNECMSTTTDLMTKHIEFGPKSHGVEVMQGILQLIKCLRGQTHSSNPETIFDDNEFAESKTHGKRKKTLVMAHNNSTYSMLKIVAAFIFGHYEFINEVTDTWHDDPKSMMNYEGSWISHLIFTVVGLTLVNLLRTENDPSKKAIMRNRLYVIRDKMEVRAVKYPTNHAAMYHLLEAEIADQSSENDSVDLRKVFLQYEKAIAYSTEGSFPLHLSFSYELAGKCHLRQGLVTSAKCFLANACKGYQNWGARGKVRWFYKTFPEWFGNPPDIETAVPARGLFYRPNDDVRPGVHTVGASGSMGGSSLVGGTQSSGSGTSPWASGSPNTMYSPNGYGNDSVSAAAAAIAQSRAATNLQNGGASSSVSSTSPVYHLQSSWSSPQSPDMDSADLDVLDFSSVIEAMQVIASEIDLDLLLVKSLGVLNQSIGAKRCCVIISKNQELVLAASQGDLGHCESVNPPMEVNKCSSLFHGVINYVIHTSTQCLLINAKDDPRFSADDYLKQRTDVKTVLCTPIVHKAAMVGVLYMEDFPERAFANKRMLVMNLLVQQLGISITNALLYQSVLQSETKLNGLLENMPCGIALWDATAENCQYINSSWEDMTGYTVDEIMDSGWRVLTHQDEVAIYDQHWRDRVQAGVPCQWESRYRLKDGSCRWAIVRMLPIKSGTDKKIIQWLTVTIDIDDQRRAVQLKSNFLANMSHELRTPFSGILGMLSLLRDSSGLSHEQFEFVDMAKASCEMLIRIVDDLLNFSKLEADKVTLEYIPLCFEEILGDVCDLLVPLASRKGLELIILFDETLPLLLIGDPDRMKQILMNLIGNAIKFSTSGNVVIEFWHEVNKRQDIIRSRNQKSSQNVLDILSGKKTRKHEVEVDDSKLGDEVVLHCAVKDQGIGMTPEEQKMLFVSFQQTDNGTTRKYGGTGLGLSICAQLIDHMHGKVTVESEKGKGATFTFTAKLRTETAYDEEQSPAESARIMECGKILQARLDVVAKKKILVLSPNKPLRQQIIKTLQGAICSEFDDMESALAGGAIMMTGECTADRPHDMDVDGVSCDPSNASELQDMIASGDSSNSAAPNPSSLERFDFILVDHVLDSAELDRIYPSPAVAFILLLAPTTETLRWILPPAVKRLDEEPEEPESGQIDIGGRGRIKHAPGMDYEAERVAGQVQRVSHELSAQSNNAALADISAGVMAMKPTYPCKLVRMPSQLFKKRRSRGLITVTRPVPHSTGTQVNGTSPRMETTTFQVCRLIKPVRRMKLLQIVYNALRQDGRCRSRVESTSVVPNAVVDGELDKHNEQSSGYDYDEFADKNRGHSTTDTTSSLPSTPSSTSLSVPNSPRSRSGSPASTSSVQSSSLKRRLDHSATDTAVEGELKRRPKLSKHNHLKSAVKSGKAGSSSLNPLGENDPPRNLGLSGDTASVNDMPKRARNNDALKLLLTPEQRRSCRGKNVLVAEDDFVSQKILEKQLSKLGMNVMIANNGQEAVSQWLSVERGHYTIAIFDHHMPIMDGLAATRKLRALEEEFAKDRTDGKKAIRIPIVGLSADIQLSTKESCIKAGMDEYMTKPLLTKGLALLIQR